jgi:DNA repair protein RadA/Sms
VPRISSIDAGLKKEIQLSAASWFKQLTPFFEGGTYLLAGDPGIGKTTLALQIATDIASSGKKVLYLSSEQSPQDLKSTVLRLQHGELSNEISSNFIIEVLAHLEDLEFWRRHLFEESDEYSNTKFIVIDSVQGGGVTPSARKPYEKLTQFTLATKNKGITTLLIAHVNKSGVIAGPKDLEHHVDCILQYKKAFKLRPLFVPKNRFGPARLDPFVLEMSEDGLSPSPHSAAKGSSVKGIDFESLEHAEVQAKVQVPRWGERPGLTAPYLPFQKIKVLVDAISQIPEIDASDLTYQINCYIPKQYVRYSYGFDLAIVTAILSSYLQLPVEPTTAFYGEVDLMGAIRSSSQMNEAQIISEVYNKVSSFGQELNGNSPESEDSDDIRFVNSLKKINTLIVPKEIVEDLRTGLLHCGLKMECKGVGFVNELIDLLWPQINV